MQHDDLRDRDSLPTPSHVRLTVPLRGEDDMIGVPPRRWRAYQLAGIESSVSSVPVGFLRARSSVP